MTAEDAEPAEPEINFMGQSFEKLRALQTGTRTDATERLPSLPC